VRPCKLGILLKPDQSLHAFWVSVARFSFLYQWSPTQEDQLKRRCFVVRQQAWMMIKSICAESMCDYVQIGAEEAKVIWLLKPWTKVTYSSEAEDTLLIAEFHQLVVSGGYLVKMRNRRLQHRGLDWSIWYWVIVWAPGLIKLNHPRQIDAPRHSSINTFMTSYHSWRNCDSKIQLIRFVNNLW